MSEVAEKLMPALLALSPEDRCEIAHRLLESLPDDDEDEAFIAELNRRSEELISGKCPSIPAEEVHRRLREKYSWLC